MYFKKKKMHVKNICNCGLEIMHFTQGSLYLKEIMYLRKTLSDHLKKTLPIKESCKRKDV